MKILLLFVLWASLVMVSAQLAEYRVDDARISDLRRMSTGWMCTLTNQELERYKTGGKIEHLFNNLTTDAESKSVVTAWLACTLHACRRELLPMYPRENNERVYLELMEQVNNYYMRELTAVNFARIAMLAVCAARPEPAKAAFMHHVLDHDRKVPDNAHVLLEVLRLMRVSMFLELEGRAVRMTELERVRYEQIFRPLGESLVRNPVAR